MNKPKLFLSGFMGSGKTSIAKHLCSQFPLRYLDTDSEIERLASLSISTIFDTYGEAHFRALESALAKTLGHYTQDIISTGGGFLLSTSTRSHCQPLGPIVYLNTSFDVLLSRLDADDSRPLARDTSTLHALYQSRQKQYETLASFTINTDNSTIAEISHQLWIYYENYCSTL